MTWRVADVNRGFTFAGAQAGILQEAELLLQHRQGLRGTSFSPQQPREGQQGVAHRRVAGAHNCPLGLQRALVALLSPLSIASLQVKACE